MQTTKFIISSLEHNNGELSDPLSDSVNRGLTLDILSSVHSRMTRISIVV